MIHQTLTIKESEAVRQIRSAVMRYGKTPSIRELMSALGYRSPRSASVIIDNLARKGVLRRKFDGKFQLVRAEDDVAHAQTIDVPLVGAAACGAPILAQENIEAMIPVSVQLAKAPYKYFLLKARGDSMDEKSRKKREYFREKKKKKKGVFFFYSAKNGGKKGKKKKKSPFFFFFFTKKIASG